MTKSLTFQEIRLQYIPEIPLLFKDDLSKITVKSNKTKIASKEPFEHVIFNISQQHKNLKALRIGILLSGGPAPGGHNVISGLFDALKATDPSSTLFGFLKGPSGLIDNKYIEITPQIVDKFRNTGGFDLLGSSRTKIETPTQFESVFNTTKKLNLDAIVIVGGDDSNTNAAILAERFIKKKIKTQVIGIPKTIDGDLKNKYIEASFGFDTATKIYSQLIGNIAKDAISAGKYWHFVRLMGRSASHIALECALQTRPNVTIISEEVEENNISLKQLCDHICDIIIKRSSKGLDYGVIIIPEGLIEFVPEIKILVKELNFLLSTKQESFKELNTYKKQLVWLKSNLTPNAQETISLLPKNILKQFLLDRDPHGNIQPSKIEMESLLIELVEKKLIEISIKGDYKYNFNTCKHFFGYEGHCGYPSNFDTNYCYTLGLTAFALISNGLTGYIATVQNLADSPSKWIPGGIRIAALLHKEKRNGSLKSVIRKTLVDLEGDTFLEFKKNRDNWALEDHYIFAQPIQYFGPKEITDIPTKTLLLEHGKH